MALTKINSSVIANNTIAVGNIADNSVDATKIASNSILTRHIDDAQITTDQILDGTIATADIADDAITSAKLDTNIDIAGTFDVTGATTLDADLTVDGATLVVDASENKVGINRSIPTAPLDVSGEVKISGDLTVDTNTLFVDASADSVGIGTTSIDGVLHVKGSTNKTIKIDPTFSSGTHTSLAFARNGSDLWRVFQNSADEYLSFYNDGNTSYDFSLTNNSKIFVNINPDYFSSYSSLGHFLIQQTGNDLGIGVIDSGANNTFKFINNGTEGKIEHNNATVPIKIKQGATTRLTIGGDGSIKSSSGGMVLQTKESYNSTAQSVSNAGSVTVNSTTITIKQGSKIAVWFHSGQVQNDGNSQNPNGHIQWENSGGTSTNITEHNGNHYGWDASTHVERMFFMAQGISGALSAGTYTVRFVGSAYNGTVTWNYQGQGSHMIIQEISAD